MIPVDADMQPLGEYYLWCDHRAKSEAQEITALAHQQKIEAIEWCGGVYSHEWGFAKLLHWLRHNPDKRARFASAFEHCDMVAATLAGVTDPSQGGAQRLRAWAISGCGTRAGAGFRRRHFSPQSTRCWTGVREKLAESGRDLRPSCRSPERSIGPSSWGCKPGIPIPVGAFDAHWDAIGAGIREGDVVNVVGTSTCIIAISQEATLVPGVCGIVPGSVHPGFTGIEAGLSATGDIFDAIARRAGTSVTELSQGLGKLSRRPDRAAAAELGQRRPHRAGECRTRRRHAGLEPAAHRAG